MICLVVIIHVVINIMKYTFNNSEKFKRLIPLLAAFLGVIIGIISFYLVPSIIPTDNVVVAIVLGGASGLSATGVNQLLKQLTKTKE